MLAVRSSLILLAATSLLPACAGSPVVRAPSPSDWHFTSSPSGSFAVELPTEGEWGASRHEDEHFVVESESVARTKSPLGVLFAANCNFMHPKEGVKSARNDWNALPSQLPSPISLVRTSAVQVMGKTGEEQELRAGPLTVVLRRVRLDDQSWCQLVAGYPSDQAEAGKPIAERFLSSLRIQAPAPPAGASK
jgi:hypothetical protein